MNLEKAGNMSGWVRERERDCKKRVKIEIKKRKMRIETKERI